MIRSLKPELMDSPEVVGPVLDRMHRDLKFIHGCLGTFPTVERFLRKGDQPVRSVLDIGCGDGALLAYLRERMGVEVVGVDLRPGHTGGIPVIAADGTRQPLPTADVAICSLLAHHLTPEENIAMIRNVARSCRRFLILDLIRHPMPLVLFSLFIAPLVSREAAADGRQSVRRAFTPEEFAGMTEAALEGTGGRFTIDVPPLLSRQIIDIRFR